MDESICLEIIEAMTTNETSFFRDQTPFDHLRNDVLPHIADKAGDTIKIWSSACSSGQEVYSIVMTLLEEQELLKGKKFSVTATDLDHAILAKAEHGMYSQFEIQRGMPITMLVKYFNQDGDHWQAKDELKQHITFKQLNLLDSYSALDQFDIIFCRNVLIYFDDATKADVINKMADKLQPHGILFVGSAEATQHLTDRYTPFNDIKGIYSLSK